MEASEKPQLPLDSPANQGQAAVRALDDRLVIERLEVIDELASRVVRDQAAQKRLPAETVRKAIEIGARIIDSESVATNVDLVKRELQGGLGELNRELSTTLETGSRELTERIAESFGADRADSVQQQIRRLVDEATEQQRLALVQLLSGEDASNPLVAVQARMGKAVLEAEERHRQEMARLREGHSTEARTMQREIAALRENLARLLEQQQAEERVAEAEEAGTRKGRSFEENVDAALERIAAARGDASSHTGGEGAEGGGKKGDTLIELGAAEGPAMGRIVFEAKDKKLSKNDAWRELNAAMSARAASFAVLVVAGEERVPAGRETLIEYEGNKLIVAVDREEPEGIALEVAYRLAAARVAMSRDRDLTVDAGAVRDAAEEALTCLKQAQAIRASLTGIKTSSDKARSSLDAMVEAVRAKLERIDALVEAADSAGTDA